MKRAKAGLSTINKDVRRGYFEDLLNQVPKVEPVNLDNCSTKLLLHNQQCLACGNNSAEVRNMLITHEEIGKATSSMHKNTCWISGGPIQK